VKGAWAIPIGCLLLGTPFLSRAQTAEQDPGTPSKPPATQAVSDIYWLRVTASELNVRCNPDTNSTIVARVPRGSVLRAVDRVREWHRITPPQGVFSFVAARYIERIGPAKGVVAIQTGSLRVRVGSLVYELDPAESPVQTRLQRGDPVRVLGTSGDWLKIAPPRGVHCYVHADFVERIDPEHARRLLKHQAAAAQPSESGSASGPPQPDLSGRWGARLLEIEEDIDAEARKPGLQQKWNGVIGRLRPVAAQRDEPPVAQLAAAWIRQLEQRVADQAIARKSAEIQRRLDRERAQHTRELERIERLRRHATSRPTFAAEGALRKSAAVNKPATGYGYKLQDPLTGRVRVYLEVKPDTPLDLEPLIGRYVGVRGKRRFVPALRTDAVLVESIEVLSRRAPASQPTRGDRNN
jgi:hypothetical protein